MSAGSFVCSLPYDLLIEVDLLLVVVQPDAGKQRSDGPRPFELAEQRPR